MMKSISLIVLFAINAHAKSNCAQNFCLNEQVAYKTSFGKIVAVDDYNQKANVEFADQNTRPAQYGLKELYKTKGCLKGNLLRFCVGDLVGAIVYRGYADGKIIGINPITKTVSIAPDRTTSSETDGIELFQLTAKSNCANGICTGDEFEATVDFKPYDQWLAGYSVGVRTVQGKITTISADGVYGYQSAEGGGGLLMNYRQVRITKFSSQYSRNDSRRGKLLPSREAFTMSVR